MFSRNISTIAGLNLDLNTNVGQPYIKRKAIQNAYLICRQSDTIWGRPEIAFEPVCVQLWANLGLTRCSFINSISLDKLPMPFVCSWVLRCIQFFATPKTVAHQTPLSEGFSRQEYWSGLPFPAPGDLRDSRIKPMSPGFPGLTGGLFTAKSCGKPLYILFFFIYCVRYWASLAKN